MAQIAAYAMCTAIKIPAGSPTCYKGLSYLLAYFTCTSYQLSDMLALLPLLSNVWLRHMPGDERVIEILISPKDVA